MGVARYSILLTLAACVCLGCTQRSEPTVPEKPEPIDAGTLGDCERACARLKACGRAEAEPTAAGATCVEVCMTVEESGTQSLMPACVAAAACDQIDECSYGGP